MCTLSDTQVRTVSHSLDPRSRFAVGRVRETPSYRSVSPISTIPSLTCRLQPSRIMQSQVSKKYFDSLKDVRSFQVRSRGTLELAWSRQEACHLPPTIFLFHSQISLVPLRGVSPFTHNLSLSLLNSLANVRSLCTWFL